jgi:hypothetical protein
MFSKITSYANFKAAYLDIVEQFSSDRRNSKYHGLDNVFLHDLDLKSRSIIKIAQKELIKKTKIENALAIKIPKNNRPGEFREVCVYNLKERIKAQAIYRVVLPEFEKVLSDRLFSYRPNKPPYLAANIFCKRYRKKFSTDYILLLDLKNYFERIDRELISKRIEKIFSDKEVLDVLRLFIFNGVYRDGKVDETSVGLVQGVPLTSLFANLFLTDLDFKYTTKSEFYIRVGDDIAFLDSSLENIEAMQVEMLRDLGKINLEINQKKLFKGKASGQFSFLGYNFNDGKISLEKNFIKKIKLGWKKLLNYKHLSEYYKKIIIQKIMNNKQTNFNDQFKQIIKDKSQINNSNQIKKISEDFFIILTKFFYKTYTPRNRRLLKSKLNDLKIDTLYKLYKNTHYERQ